MPKTYDEAETKAKSSPKLWVSLFIIESIILLFIIGKIIKFLI
jgi:hypothetical protein